MLDKIINGFPVKIVGGQRQVRKHKKKRINKKWAKIYGYKYYSPLENGKTYIMDGTIYMNRWTYEYLLHCMNAVYGKTGELPIYVGRRQIIMIKLNDILSIMEPAQDLRIYVGDSEWIGMTAYAALQVINDKTQQRNVTNIEICDGSVFIRLEQEQDEINHEKT